MKHPIHCPPSQRGAAALTVTLVLFFVMTMVAAYAHRNHLFELRATANHVRATQAFEAAEAGLEWGLAMLNDPRPVDAQCQPRDGDEPDFRKRHLAVSTITGALEPRTGDDEGRAACVRDGNGWQCSCPVHGEAVTAVAAGTDAPAFALQLAAGPRPGLLRLQATGCSQAAGACNADDGKVADATARTQAIVGLVPALATAPVAALTVRDDIQAGDASLGLHNADTTAGGIAVHAGGQVLAPHARIATAAGGPPSAAVVESDGALRALDGERVFASFFGLDKATWARQPVVARVDCSADCSEALRRAAEVHSLLWVEGDLQLDGAVRLGSPERPLAIVATGAVHVQGQPVIYGVLYGRGFHWDGSGSLYGAAISEAGYTGSGAPDLVYEPLVLRTLMRHTGSFARVPGSWRDF